MEEADPPPLIPPTALRLFVLALKIGLLSVGGNMSSWMYRELVMRRGWVKENDFLGDLAVARVLPGTNITNVVVIIGFRLLGTKGSIAGFSGLLLGPFCVLILLSYWYDRMQGPVLEAVLQGAAAGALGPVVYLTLRSARHGGGYWYTGLVLIAVTVAAILKIPLLLVIAVALPVSLLLVWIFHKL